MKYCFIIANKRHDYFSIDKVVANIKHPTCFILIIESNYLYLLSEDFKRHLHSIVAVNKIDFDECKKIISANIPEKNIIRDSCIVCTDEVFLMMAARLREYFGMNGAKPYQYIPFHNKRRMKQVLAIKGINVPRFMDFDGLHAKNSLNEYHNYLHGLFSGPYIIKPIDGGSSADTVKVSHHNDLQRWYLNSFSENIEYGVEEFIAGDFYMCDSFILGGHPKFVAVSKYLYPCLEFLEGKTLGGFPVIKDSLYNKVVSFNQSIIDALQPPDGVLHMEFFVKNGEITFIEIGARPAGKSVCEIHKKNYAINLYELVLRHELGIPLDFTIKEDLYHCWICLCSHPGTVNKLQSPKLLSEHEIKWNISVGQKIQHYPLSINEGIAADITLYNANYNQLLKDIEILKHHKAYI